MNETSKLGPRKCRNFRSTLLRGDTNRRNADRLLYYRIRLINERGTVTREDRICNAWLICVATFHFIISPLPRRICSRRFWRAKLSAFPRNFPSLQEILKLFIAHSERDENSRRDVRALRKLFQTFMRNKKKIMYIRFGRTRFVSIIDRPFSY